MQESCNVFLRQDTRIATRFEKYGCCKSLIRKKFLPLTVSIAPKVRLPLLASALTARSMASNREKNLGPYTRTWHTGLVSWLGNRRLPQWALLIKGPEGAFLPTSHFVIKTPTPKPSESVIRLTFDRFQVTSLNRFCAMPALSNIALGDTAGDNLRNDQTSLELQECFALRWQEPQAKRRHN